MEKSVNEDGSYSLEVRSTFGNIDNITIDGQSVKFKQKACSDGNGSCLDFSSIPSSLINKECKNKNDTVKVKVNYTSSDSLDKMKMYKAKNCPGCQFLIGFSANSQKTEKEIEIPCKDIPEDHDPCLDDFTDPDTGEKGCTDNNGNFDPSCEKYMEECDPGECIENYTNPKTGEVGCRDDKGKWDPTCENYKKFCENSACEENYTDPDTGETGCTDSSGNFDPTCDKYMEECDVGYCEEKENPKTGEKVCYGKNGQTSCDTWKEECKDELKCTIDEDGNYYDSEGNPTDENGYKEDCTCNENSDGTYTGPYGNEVSKQEYDRECFCSKVGDTCRGKQGQVIDCANYSEECEDPQKPQTCPSSFEDTTPQSACQNGLTEGTLKDPEICSIMKNKDINYKNDEMSQEYCNVYCREVLDFKFMDVETAQAGRYFNHNVTAYESENLLSIQNLSTVIKSTQQCGSEIQYKEWKAEFLAVLEEVRENWNNLKMFEEYHTIGIGTSGKPNEKVVSPKTTDICTKAVYPEIKYIYYWNRETGEWYETDEEGNEQYKSGTTSNGEPNDAGHWECDENDPPHCTCIAGHAGHAGDENYVINMTKAYASAYAASVKRRDDLVKMLHQCNFMKDTEMIQHYQYNKQNYHTNEYEPVYDQRTPYLQKTDTNYYKVQQYFPNNEASQEFDYEENTTFNENFPTRIENVYENDPIGTDDALGRVERKWVVDDEYKWDNYCGGCAGDLSNGATSIPFEEDTKMKWFNCEGSALGAKCDLEYVEKHMPTSAAASDTLWRVTGHYQAQDFFTEIFTGDVKTSDSNDRIELPKSSWPVGRLRETNYQQGDPYDIYVNLGSDDRKPAIDFVNRSDGFKEQVCGYEVINEMEPYDCDDGYHICYNCDDPTTPEVEPCPNPDCPGSPSGKCPDGDAGFFFRSVDLSDLFPNSMYSPVTGGVATPVSTRPIGSNWNYIYEPSVLEKVKRIQEDLGNDIWTKATPQYVVILTPTAMRKIDSFNNTIDYLDKETLNCGKNLYCRSRFLESNLRNILRSESGAELYTKNSNANQNLYVAGGAI